ncbi:hypothetical protein XELAEV_18027543mg [Xenopus laevis]|uniref:Uncharacterized protein n=1 Tax=Xenopus laevis TaxID=8355 RepID=A0A974CVK9_XENLA|nr:hypothetical protein XELAEV_18027543mg [Xenopus laevis]
MHVSAVHLHKFWCQQLSSDPSMLERSLKLPCEEENRSLHYYGLSYICQHFDLFTRHASAHGICCTWSCIGC